VHLPVPGSDTLVLSRILQDHSYVLLFFYSSTCEHCHDEMPPLVELHRKYVDRGFSVVGIALDADTSEFHETIREEGLPWSSTSELSGWGSLAAKSYVVKATPAMFLLDRTGTIIAKPFDAHELAELLGSLYP
jgi:peroxiredoxin